MCNSPFLFSQSSDSWTSQSPDCHVFSVLLKQCPGATLETLVACTLGIAAGILQDPERSVCRRHVVLKQSRPLLVFLAQ